MCLWDMKATPTLISQYYPFILFSVIPAIFYQFVPYSGNTNIQSEIMFDCLVQFVSCSFFIFLSDSLSLSSLSPSLLSVSLSLFVRMPLHRNDCLHKNHMKMKHLTFPAAFRVVPILKCIWKVWYGKLGTIQPNQSK